MVMFGVGRLAAGVGGAIAFGAVAAVDIVSKQENSTKRQRGREKRTSLPLCLFVNTDFFLFPIGRFGQVR